MLTNPHDVVAEMPARRLSMARRVADSECLSSIIWLKQIPMSQTLAQQAMREVGHRQARTSRLRPEPLA